MNHTIGTIHAIFPLVMTASAESKTMKPQTPFQFFLKHAGWSYDPKTQTIMQAKAACARALAKAERRARDTGLSFAWHIDNFEGSKEWTNEKPAWATWQCLCRNASGDVVASLYGIDFGRNGEPWGDSYRRVVEAELALEALA